eukprot:scaffold141_cov232-Pinguiococcus_pyrenoidosus.AAC.10
MSSRNASSTATCIVSSSTCIPPSLGGPGPSYERSSRSASPCAGWLPSYTLAPTSSSRPSRSSGFACPDTERSFSMRRPSSTWSSSSTSICPPTLSTSMPSSVASRAAWIAPISIFSSPSSSSSAAASSAETSAASSSSFGAAESTRTSRRPKPPCRTKRGNPSGPGVGKATKAGSDRGDGKRASSSAAASLLWPTLRFLSSPPSPSPAQPLKLSSGAGVAVKSTCDQLCVGCEVRRLDTIPTRAQKPPGRFEDPNVVQGLQSRFLVGALTRPEVARAPKENDTTVPASDLLADMRASCRRPRGHRLDPHPPPSSMRSWGLGRSIALGEEPQPSVAQKATVLALAAMHKNTAFASRLRRGTPRGSTQSTIGSRRRRRA